MAIGVGSMLSFGGTGTCTVSVTLWESTYWPLALASGVRTCSGQEAAADGPWQTTEDGGVIGHTLGAVNE